MVRLVIACSSLTDAFTAKIVHQKPQLKREMMPNRPLKRKRYILKDRQHHLERFGDLVISYVELFDCGLNMNMRKLYVCFLFIVAIISNPPLMLLWLSALITVWLI